MAFFHGSRSGSEFFRIGSGFLADPDPDSHRKKVRYRSLHKDPDPKHWMTFRIVACCPTYFQTLINSNSSCYIQQCYTTVCSKHRVSLIQMYLHFCLSVSLSWREYFPEAKGCRCWHQRTFTALYIYSCTLLDKFSRISLYVANDAIAKLYVK